MTHHRLLSVALVIGALLSGCDRGTPAGDPAVETQPQAAPAAEQAAPAPAAPLIAAGPAATLPPDADADLQGAASVVRLDELRAQGDYDIKLFGTAGGDPAMNGLYSYIAFFLSPDEGWSVFKLGDFLDYRILSQAPGRVDIEVEESVLDAATSAISSRKRRLIVTWAEPDDGGAPPSVTVTPAR